jgi:aspartate carbamoyltransferase regulatory subunit
MTAQTVGEAELYQLQLLEAQHQILQSFLVQEKACSRHPVEINVVFKCMARRIVSQPDNPNSNNLLQLNGHLSNAHSCESHHRAQE